MNLTWHENSTVSYRRVKFWYFEREMSVGPLTDEVTTINVPVVGSAEFVRGDFFMEWGISDMLSTIEVIISSYQAYFLKYILSIIYVLSIIF